MEEEIKHESFFEVIAKHSKSLQLSPKRPPGTVNVACQFHKCGVDAAGQLNSMLGRPRIAYH